MSQYGIDWLRESSKNNSDGTFSRCPKLFYQFYVIFGQKNDYILPCVYCLLPNKTQQSYTHMLSAIKDIVKPIGDHSSLPFLPDTALTDFETAIQNAFVHQFPLIVIKGCFFHFKHAIHGWICRHGYKRQYMNVNNFRIWVNMFGALAFVPLNRLVEGLNIIKNKIIEGIDTEPIIAYFEKTWINGNWSPSVWNYFDYIGRKTNNDLECFNRQLNRFVTSANPSIFKFLNFLQRIDTAMSLQVNEYRQNPLNPSKCKKSSKKLREEAIFIDLKNAFIAGELNLNDYMYAIAANIEFTEYSRNIC